MAVASPELIARHGPLHEAEEPENFPLLQGADEPWIHWLEVGGRKPNPVRGSVLDDSVSVLMAKRDALPAPQLRSSPLSAMLTGSTFQMSRQ